MESDKDQIELIKIGINLLNQMKNVNKKDVNDIKNLYLILSSKTNSFNEIYEMVKMKGGIIGQTLTNIKQIENENGREIGRKEGKK